MEKKKTSKEQKNTAMQTRSPNQLIIGVGNNDLEKKDTSTCVSEMKSLLGSILDESENSYIHVLPAFERVGKTEYNLKVSIFNSEIKEFCIHIEKCKFIENKLISSLDPSQITDGVHFSNNGSRNLVRFSKAHLSPFIGLKTYDGRQQSRNQRGSREPRWNETRGEKNGTRWNETRGGSNGNNRNKEREINNIVRYLMELTR